jgi:hypothetical protein
VHAVKDYSPLFGRVKKGDKIVEVGGRITKHSTLTEITKLLSVKPGRRGSNANLRNLRKSVRIQSEADLVEKSSNIADSRAAISGRFASVDGGSPRDTLKKLSFRRKMPFCAHSHSLRQQENP